MYCICPCGGGQNCIVHRRSFNDIVIEDEVFKNKNIPLRVNCYAIYTKEQMDAMIQFETNTQYDSLIC